MGWRGGGGSDHGSPVASAPAYVPPHPPPLGARAFPPLPHQPGQWRVRGRHGAATAGRDGPPARLRDADLAQAVHCHHRVLHQVGGTGGGTAVQYNGRTASGGGMQEAGHMESAPVGAVHVGGGGVHTLEHLLHPPRTPHLGTMPSSPKYSALAAPAPHWRYRPARSGS